jgi:2-polyprenyl-6-methoxyphenol hydroxylase-like FAD-dependent oxidoreductase
MNSDQAPNAVYSPATTTPDVFVAGGGPAGLACAISAALHGLTVEVADSMTPPIDKACGEGLMPDTIEALAQLGIDLPPTQSAPFRGIRFLGTNRAGSPVTAQAAFPADPGRGIRRTILHQLLVDRATALGVQFSWQTAVLQVENLQQGTAAPKYRSIVHTNRHTIHPRFIIGADGNSSRVRTWASLDRTTYTAIRIGLRQHFKVEFPPDFVEVHWSNHGQAYVTPVSPREICVAFVATTKFPSIASALTHFPRLQQQLHSATPTNAPRGSITLSRKLHRVTRGNVALIGDASGSVDAVTGEGLGLSFRQAIALGQALRNNDLAPYQQAHRAIQRLPYFMGRTMLLLDSSPNIRNLALPLLERHPTLFERLLSVHIGHNSGQPLHPTVIPVS